MNKKSINAIYDDDLIVFLDKIWILEDIKEWKVKCKFTATVITLNNVFTIFYESWVIKVVCDTIVAQKDFYEYINSRNG